MKWDLLPHAESDYIFAIIGEELGFLGCLVVVLLYGVLAYAGFRIARRSTDRFIQLASVAITVWLVGQATMNIGYVVGLLPVTGVPLPLISAGGTSLVLTLFIVGLLACFARTEPAAIEAAARQRPRAAGRGCLLPGARAPRSTRCGRAGEPPGPRRPARGAERPAAAGAAGRHRPAGGAAGDRPAPGDRSTAPGRVSVVLAGGGTAGHIEPCWPSPTRCAAGERRDLRITAWAPPAAWRPRWCRPAATTCG